MKITKTQLKEIIREEINKIKSKSSMKLKPMIEGWMLSEDGETIVNPETNRKIKVSTALSYSKDHPAYKAAVKFQNKDKDSARKAVSALRGGKDGTVSSSDKTDKIISNIVDSDGKINYNAIDKMSSKSKTKLARVLNTRIALVDKITDKVWDGGQKISDSYSESGANSSRSEPQEDGSQKFESGMSLSKKDYERYSDALYDFRSNDDTRDYGDGAEAIFNAQWSLKNPQTPTIDLDTAKEIQADADKLKLLQDKQKSLIPPNGLRGIRNLVDELE